MPSKLQKVISYYEKERDELEALIAECVAEHEYKLAHLHSKGLQLAYQKLQAFHRLADPLYDEKQFCLRTIESTRKTAAEIAKITKLPPNFFDARIRQAQEKLEQLNQVPIPAPTPQKQSLLQDALTKLGDRKIDNFTLLIDEVKRISFTVRLVRQTLFITLPEVRRLRAEYALHKKQIRYFQQLGFRLYDHKDKLILWLHYDGEPTRNRVRTLLARAVFEGFYYKDFSGHASIKYVEKPAA